MSPAADAPPIMKGVSFKNPGDAQKTGMKDTALQLRFRAVQRKGAELSKQHNVT